MSVRKEIEEVLQKTKEGNSDTERSVLIKWVAVMDWTTPEGERYITRIGSEDLSSWDRSGLLHYALNGNWR